MSLIKLRNVITLLTTIVMLLAIISMAVSTPKKHVSAKGKDNDEKGTAVQVLDKGKWAPNTYNSVQQLINNYGENGPKYNSNNAPYAVFDWDDTSIINDVTDKFFIYQIDQLAYKLTPSEFAKVIKLTVPNGPFSGEVKNNNGEQITLEKITRDLNRDYKYLYNHYSGLKGNQPLEKIHQTNEFKDFKIKLYFLYQAINETYGAEVAYPWEIFFVANMTKSEVSKLAINSHRHSLQVGITDVNLTSPVSMKGDTGVVSISYTDGMRLAPEISNLMHTFKSNKIDVYVVSAGFEPVVEAIASSPEFGYNIPKNHVFGLRLEKNDQKQFEPMYKNGYPFTYREGKPDLIRSKIAIKKGGKDPIFIAGDSNSDYGNFTELNGIKLGMIVNHLSSGDFGKVSKKAVEQMGKANPKFVLQGVNENTGLWIPSESTIELGTNKEVLLNQELK